MANKIEPTVEEPLKFFQWMFSENVFSSYKHNFFAKFEGYDIIEKNDDEVSYYGDVYDENTGNIIRDVVYRKSFSKELKTTINSEYNNSVKLIKEAIANITYRGNNNLSSYLNLLHTYIQELLTYTRPTFEVYPFIEEYFIRINLLIEKEQDRINPKDAINVEGENNNVITYRGNNNSLDKLEAYLLEKRLIGKSPSFSEILKGQPSVQKINWIAPKNLFHYFIDKLCELDNRILSFNRDKRWIVASNAFTIKDNFVDHQDIKSNDSEPISKKKKIIDEAIKIINY